jgi:hypothetical protein
MYLYHGDSSDAFEDIDLVMRNPTCIYGFKHHKMIETTINTNILVKMYMYIIVKWDNHITLVLPHHWSGHWMHHYIALLLYSSNENALLENMVKRHYTMPFITYITKTSHGAKEGCSNYSLQLN